MKKGIIRLWDNLVVAVLALLGCGLAACATDYGSVSPIPPHSFKLKGTVSSRATQEPLEGIRVVRSMPYEHDTTYTDGQGQWQFLYHGFDADSCQVKAEDVDGAAGGGRFAPDSITVAFTDDDVVNDADAVVREYVKNIDFSLKPQSEDQPAEAPQP